MEIINNHNYGNQGKNKFSDIDKETEKFIAEVRRLNYESDTIKENYNIKIHEPQEKVSILKYKMQNRNQPV